MGSAGHAGRVLGSKKGPGKVGQAWPGARVVARMGAKESTRQGVGKLHGPSSSVARLEQGVL